jgi:AsmA protein
MKKIFKILGLIFATIIVLIAISFAAITVFIDPNDFKPEISQIVQQKTGREFAIAGDISWRFFPWLGIKVENATLGNAPDFAGKNFAQIGELDVSFRLIPLLFGEVRAGNLKIKNAKLYLITDKFGKNNWDDLITSPTASTATKPVVLGTKKTQLVVMIAGINISDGNVFWDDQQSGQSAQLTNLYFHSSSVNLLKPVDVSAKFDWQAAQNKQQLGQGHVDFKSKIIVDLAAKKYQFNNLYVTGYVKTPSITKNLDYEVAGDFVIDVHAEIYTIKNFKIQIANFIAKGEILNKKNLGISTYEGKITIPEFNPTELLNDLGVDYQPQDSSAFKSASAKFSFQGSGANLKIPALQLLLDRSVVQGSISNLNFEKKLLNFTLTFNELNLNRYLPKAVTSNKNKTKAEVSVPSLSVSKTKAASASSNTNIFDQWAISGNLNINNLVVNKLQATKVVMPVTISRSIMTLSPKAGFYNGTLVSKFTFDSRSNLLKTTADLSLLNVNLAPLLNDLTNTRNFTGIANFKAILNTTGSASSTILRNLNGRGSLEVNNGSLKFMDVNSIFVFAKGILDIVKMPINIVTKQQLPSFKPGSGVTNFDKLSATYTITNGIIGNKDLLLTASDYKVTGKGTVNLVSKRVDYLLNASTSALTINKQQLGLVEIPVKISGTFDNLHYYPDTTALLKAATTGRVKDIGQKISDTLKNGGNVGQSIKDIGKSLGF